MRRRKIHTHVKVLEYLGALPQNYRSTLHPSQLCRYRLLKPEEYFGSELSATLNKELDWIRQFGDFPRAKQLSFAILKLFVFFRSTLRQVRGFKTALRGQKNFFVELSQRFRPLLPLRTFCKLIALNEATLYSWIRQVRVTCSDSCIHACRKVHPNQLLLPEVSKMKKLLTDNEFRFWPLSSLYWHALKNNLVSMGKSTWYNYAALISEARLKPKTIKVKTTGIRASRPNELWHADVTYFITPEKIKLYIYTVIDNFSRFPLCVKVSDKLCGRMRVESFRQALRKAAELSPTVEILQIMTDGGSENFNGDVSTFLENTDEIDIRHIKALTGGWPSNSMVEAFHYILKCFYLNHMDVHSLPALDKALECIVGDYSYKRPHDQLKGLTPFQAYTGHRPEDVSFVSQLESAGKIRVMLNQNHACSGKCNF